MLLLQLSVLQMLIANSDAALNGLEVLIKQPYSLLVHHLPRLALHSQLVSITKLSTEPSDHNPTNGSVHTALTDQTLPLLLTPMLKHALLTPTVPAQPNAATIKPSQLVQTHQYH